MSHSQGQSSGLGPPRLDPRPGYSRTITPTVLSGEELLLGDAVAEDTVEYLHDFVHPHHHEGESTLVEDETLVWTDENEQEERSRLPWWKRPSPWWLIGMLPFTAIAMSATIAPKVEIYTLLACRTHKPDIFYESDFYLNKLQGLATRHDMFMQGINATSSILDQNRCASDPVVQAAVAKLAAVLTASMGVLSCLTTALWGSFSDRHGRTRVLGISAFGLLLTDMTFILVYFYAEQLPGNYWFLVIGPLVEGALGGMTSAIAAIHAYVADTTTPSNRSRMFSMNTGLMFTGVAIGPIFGGVLIRLTHQPISVFYVSTLVHIFYSFLVWFIIPESLSKMKMKFSIAKYRREMDNTSTNGTSSDFLSKSKKWFFFLTPLGIFMPHRVRGAGLSNKASRKRDWNLGLLAFAYACAISILGSYTSKFQYAADKFKWNSEIISYWISLIGAVRAFHLTILLPVIIKLFKPVHKVPPPARASRPSEEHDPLISSTTSPANSSSRSHSHSPSRLIEPHSSKFDLWICLVSLLIDIVAYSCMGLASHPLAFTLSGIINSFGGGLGPALQSVSIDLYTRTGETETGKLFGAFAVLQALSSQILGPAMYGLIYMNTVKTYPRTIFFVSVGTVSIAFISLLFVRLPDNPHKRNLSQVGEESDVEEQLLPDHALVRDATLVADEIDEGPARK